MKQAVARRSPVCRDADSHCGAVEMTIAPVALVNTRQAPYLSVVVTSRNDAHGGDPLMRLQAFINSFDAQCRRTGLDAEVIIVEWNPPPDRPRLHTLVRWPEPCVCTYRFVDVPAEVHNTLRYADVLPLFQMIAKNVGIRRARGRFVLATNIDIIFSNELIDYMASGRLEPGHMYRVDRHDIESAFPVDATLDLQMEYCAAHQLRVHAQWGSYGVDPRGRPTTPIEDIVDGRSVVLGSGWHVREGDNRSGYYRWATDRAELHIDPSADPASPGEAALEIVLESNPYDPASAVEIEVVDAAQNTVTRATIARRRIVRFPLEGGSGRRTLVLRAVGGAVDDHRRRLAVFERRGAMHYQVRSIRIIRLDDAHPREAFAYPASGWCVMDNVVMQKAPGGDPLSVVTDQGQWSYCLEYGPLRARATGTLRFAVTCDVHDGGVGIGVLSADRQSWMPSSRTDVLTPRGQTSTIAVPLRSGDQFSLVLTNDHPRGHVPSRFTVTELTGSAPAATLVMPPTKPALATRAIRGVLARMKRGGRIGAKALRVRLRRRRRVMRSVAQQALQFPLSGWRTAERLSPTLKVAHGDGGVSVVSEQRQWSYCVEYGPVRAPAPGTYTFEVRYEALEGAASLGVLSGNRRSWLQFTSKETIDGEGRTLTASATLRGRQKVWLMLFNNHPDGDGMSRFVVRQLTAKVAVQDALSAAWERVATVVHQAVSRPVPRVRAAISARRDRTRRRIVYSSPEYAAAEQAYRNLEHTAEESARLSEVEHVYGLLQQYRPDPLHLNGCGDFQLMAREHWFDLRGYPEFHTFSMNIDGLFSSVAHYAGVRERALESPCHIYHLEHEVGSGWTPEGEAVLRGRMAERGITWLDSRDIFLWSAYMHWLQRPMVFNTSDWGFGACELSESIIQR